MLPDADQVAARPAADAESPPRSARRAAGTAVVLAVLAGVVLRFVAPSALWLDEAQSVAIARSDVGGLLAALREDGSPPLYYLLLHGWTSVFGTGAFAVRALSGLFSVLSLLVAWWLARRLAGPGVAIALTLLLASSPFAVRYASETRMYSLVVLLVLLGAAAVHWAVRRPGAWPVLAVAASGAALLFTHYWAVNLLVVVGLLALAGLRLDRAAAVRVLIGLGLAALVFLPWLPTLRYQAEHTGTPWAAVGGLTAIPEAMGGWQGGGQVGAVLLGDAFVVLAVLALVAVPAGDVVRLGVSRSPRRWALVALSLGTLVVAGLTSMLSSSAVGARYSSVAFPAFLALVALGIAVVPDGRTRVAVLTLCVGTGLSLSVAQADVPRTQAAEVADALRSASPGDTVLFCPDQLGPAVSLLAPTDLELVGYPDLHPAGRVDWTDYADRNGAANPSLVAARVSARAGAHAVYVVSSSGYRVPSDADCTELREALAALRGEPRQVVRRDPSTGEDMRLHRFPSATG